jgi:hypothetical protein
MDPAAYAAQRILAPEEKAATALTILSTSDPDAFNRQVEAEWTAEQREQHTESLAAILDPVAYDRATQGQKPKEQLATEAAARFAILEPDAFNAQVRARMTLAELAQVEAERASFAGKPAVPAGN